MRNSKWYIKPTLDAIASYIFDLCISSEGETITVDYDLMWNSVKQRLEKIGVTEKRFRYVWRLFLNNNSDMVVSRYRHRGKTVFRREICDRVIVPIIITKIADKIIDTENMLQLDKKLQEALRYLRQLLEGGRTDGAEREQAETYASGI